jgi:hypothetical protein
MVPFSVVVRHELVDRADQAPFPEQDQPVQTLLANRPHEPFRVSVGVRSPERRQDDTYPRPFEEASKFLRPLAVPVADEDPNARKRRCSKKWTSQRGRCTEIARALLHPNNSEPNDSECRHQGLCELHDVSARRGNN